MERRLGRGLGALLREPAETPVEAPRQEIAVDDIRPNRYQPRTHFDPQAIEELGNSIRAHGVLQPLVVLRDGKGFELIAGERRWRAAKLAGLTTVPAVVREELTEQQMLELALVENVQRRDLDPIERARGFRRLIDELGLTQSAVSERVGLKRSTVTNHLRLLDLPARVQEEVSKGSISMGHARALLGLEREPDRVRLAARIAAEGLSVRDVEKLVRAIEEPIEDESTREGSPVASKQTGRRRGSEEASQRPEAWISATEDRLRQRLGTKVQVENRPGYKGRIVVEYFGREELDRILELLAPKKQI